MRILSIDCAPFIGGAQESLWTLLSQLQRVSCCAALVSADNGLRERAKALDIPAWSIHCRHWPASLKGCVQFLKDRAAAQKVIQDAIADFKPDVIHANTVRAALLTGSPFGYPLVIHDRDIRMPGFIPRILTRKQPARVIAISAAVAEKWRGMLPDSRITVLPNAFDLNTMKTQAKALVPPGSASVSTPQAVILAQIADFSPWKGHRDFIQAVKLLHGQHTEIRAVIKGRTRDSAGSALKESLERLIQRLGMSDIIQIDASDETALPTIASADIVVSTADQEPFGRTAIEALALGKPVVAYRSGGIVDILEQCPEAASLTPPGSPQALADAIVQWLPPERRAKAESPARAAAMSYDISTVLPRFLTMLNV